MVSKATVGTNTGSNSFHSKTFSLLEAEVCQHMESLTGSRLSCQRSKIRSYKMPLVCLAVS